jgi:wyosine [tRNA(Phe)-imidazoG37] synthetase (radical SAM superfamily)
MIAFGPVPSRRLGRSLGINNIPHKSCSYSCVYCQVGRTRSFRLEPQAFYDPDTIVRAVGEKLALAREAGDSADYLSFVADGEPTLDANLQPTIEALQPFGIRIAVITNASLIWRPEVRRALRAADWVSLKIDAASEKTWLKINRPHRGLRLGDIKEGMLEFRRECSGTLATETMLVRDLNDDEENLAAIAAFLSRLKPQIAYLSIPTRPPAEAWVLHPREEVIPRAHRIIGRSVARVELLIGYEGDAFAYTGDPEQDLLSITAVHPMREDAVGEFLRKAQADRSVVRGLVDRDLLVESEYEGKRFYVRRFPKSGRSS